MKRQRFEKKKYKFFLVKKIVKNALQIEQFLTYRTNSKYFLRYFSHTDTLKISSRSDRNCLSCTTSQVEKCSFEKKSFKSSSLKFKN